MLQASACIEDDAVMQYGSAFLLEGDLEEQKRHLEVHSVLCKCSVSVCLEFGSCNIMYGIYAVYNENT